MISSSAISGILMVMKASVVEELAGNYVLVQMIGPHTTGMTQMREVEAVRWHGV